MSVLNGVIYALLIAQYCSAAKPKEPKRVNVRPSPDGSAASDVPPPTNITELLGQAKVSEGGTVMDALLLFKILNETVGGLDERDLDRPMLPIEPKMYSKKKEDPQAEYLKLQESMPNKIINFVPEAAEAKEINGHHKCPCVSSENDDKQTLKYLRWLHAPKTGTSFFATLFGYACRTKGEVDLDVSTYYSQGCASCYDYALLERYPAEEYCDEGFNTVPVQSQHAPLMPQSHHPKDDIRRAVAIFREPTARLASAALNNHVSGFDHNLITHIGEKCHDRRNAGLHPKCYAEYPGIAGCYTRMLTGNTCADKNGGSEDAAELNVTYAIEVLKRMAFVGLTEDWNRGVCLFHKMFGGRIRQEEFRNIHPTKRGKELKGSSSSTAYRDPYDEEVYKAAKERYAELLKQHDAEKCYEFVPANDVRPKPCIPQGCEQRGFQCGGPFDNGCGGTLTCGQCPQKRGTAWGIKAYCGKDNKCYQSEWDKQDLTGDTSSLFNVTNYKYVEKLDGNDLMDKLIANLKATDKDGNSKMNEQVTQSTNKKYVGPDLEETKRKISPKAKHEKARRRRTLTLNTYPDDDRPTPPPTRRVYATSAIEDEEESGANGGLGLLLSFLR